MTAALDIRGLRVEYPSPTGPPLVAVDDVSLVIQPGEIHAVVGESGAGKTTIANALIGLIEKPGHVAAGDILIGGVRLDPATGKGEGLALGKDIGVIFQDPMTSLNPLFTIEAQLTETMRHHLGLSAAEARARAVELLTDVGPRGGCRPIRTSSPAASARGSSSPAPFPAGRSC
jgi:peptide/nickel transport system ATP-binding protein